MPRELFDILKGSGLEIRERFQGIYYIEGNVLFETQVVVTSQLNQKMHHGLRILSRHAREEDVRAFIREAVQMAEPGDRNNAEAILQVSISANRSLFEEIRRDSGMCEALRTLMKEDLEEEREKARDNAMLASITNLMDSMKWTAEQAMDALRLSGTDRARYAARL